MAKIKGIFIYFDKVNANGTVISKDCKIDFPEKISIISEDNCEAIEQKEETKEENAEGESE